MQQQQRNKLHGLCEEIKGKWNMVNIASQQPTSSVSNRNEWILVIFSFVVIMTGNVNINNLLLHKPHLEETSLRDNITLAAIQMSRNK